MEHLVVCRIVCLLMGFLTDSTTDFQVETLTRVIGMNVPEQINLCCNLMVARGRAQHNKDVKKIIKMELLR